MLKGRGLDPDRFEKEMKDWIKDFGSVRLRRAAERGYKVNATYARERAALEFPDFWVHTRPEEIWSERTDPSEDALELEQAVLARPVSRADDLSARIVWLTGPPADLDENLEEAGEIFEPCEAILLRPYLGRYSLLRPLEWPRRETGDA